MTRSGCSPGQCDRARRRSLWARAISSERTSSLGSPSLRAWVDEYQPRLVVCGHIHGGCGVHQAGRTTVVNAALMDEAYRPVNAVQVVEIATVGGFFD